MWYVFPWRCFPFADSTPRAYRLKVSNAAPLFSTSAGTFRRKINSHNPHAHHDALEFPDGEVVLLTNLLEGQRATVLQLPATPRVKVEVEEQEPESLGA